MDLIISAYLTGFIIVTLVVLHSIFVLNVPKNELDQLRAEGKLIFGLNVTKCILERALIWPLISSIWLARFVKTYNQVRKQKWEILIPYPHL